jgi:hypothetical protein
MLTIITYRATMSSALTIGEFAMKKRLMFFSVLALVVVTMMWSTETVAYGTFAGGCNNCHDWDYGTDDHQLHFDNGCSSCHVNSGDNPSTSRCAACHIGETIMNDHNNDGITACIVCHSDVSNENRTWGQTKLLFK